MTRAENLWHQLLRKLESASLLTLTLMTETPAEIARLVQLKTDDSRVHRFVWNYYYPCVFGEEAGSMTAAEAEALVQSFHGYRRPEQVATSAHFVASNTPRPKACEVCGRRKTISEVVR